MQFLLSTVWALSPSLVSLSSSSNMLLMTFPRTKHPLQPRPSQHSSQWAMSISARDEGLRSSDTRWQMDPHSKFYSFFCCLNIPFIIFTANLNLIDHARCLFWWCQADCCLTLSILQLQLFLDWSWRLFLWLWSWMEVTSTSWHPRMTRAPSCTWVRLGCTNIMTQCMAPIPAVLHIAPCPNPTRCRLLVRVLIKICAKTKFLSLFP